MSLVIVLSLWMSQEHARQLEPAIVQAAGIHNIDPLLIIAVIYRETRFKRYQCYRGAHGLMQIQLDNKSCSLKAKIKAQKLGLYDPNTNIAKGVALMAYWRQWWHRKGVRSYHWLLHYNQGYGLCPANLKRCTLKTRIPITSGRIGLYAKRVLAMYHWLQRRFGHESAA